MSSLSVVQKNVVKMIAEKFKNKQYAIRGTASLVLQNIEMNVADVDVICDSETAILANVVFSNYSIDSVSLKESSQFKSYFGKFKIDGVDVEFMGDWQIKDKKGNWSKVFDGSNYNTILIDDIEINVTKIEDELEMFLLMGRFTAYQKIKRQLNSFANENRSISNLDTNASNNAQKGLFA